ncbi:MAG: hypothetical protein KDA75_08805, partial [Planctomycetaceae bacterium]|nr:hypothetical protein [Planctomycetaceae bacterium]
IEVVNSTFHGNYTTGGSSEGGAIFSHRGAITIVNSTLSGNQTQSDGGGIFAVYSDVTIVNSTITGNSAAGRGGGIDFFPNAYDGESLTIHNSIVAGNSAATNPDFTIPGGPAGSLEVRYSLIGDNEGTTLIEAQSRDVNGNFIGDADSGGVIDPRLATLQDNGGATLTHDLLPNSLAFNGGDNTLAVDPTDFDSPLTTDQRGPSFVRSFAGRVDMGAVESRDLTGRFVVDSAADVVDGNITNGHRSLREVVDLANRTFGVDTVTFAPALDGTALLLTSGQIDILEGIDFVGNGTANTIIDAQQNSRIFAIAGFRNNVTLDSLTLQNGRTTAGLDKGGAVVVGGLSTLHATRSRITGSSTAGTNAEGGAIAAVYGNVVLVDSTLSGNWTSGLSGEGGAVFSRYGTITVRGSTLHANFTTGESSEGGAIAAFNGNVTIVNSTLSGNRVEGGDTFGGGGLFADAGDVVVVNSTITGNSAPRAGGLEIYPNDNGESLTVYNSIIAGNLAATNPDFTAPANPGANLTVRFSLIGNNSGTMLAEDQSGSSGNFIGGGTAGTAINPLLAPLADNGGPTQTHALLPGSLALNTGNNALAVDHIMSPLTSDQRGAPFHRIFGSAVDIGAFEDQALLITGNNAFLTGTVNPDSIVYRVGNGQININGVTYVLPSNIKMLQVDALEGSDVLNLIGTSGNESGLTRPGTVFFEHDSTHAGFDFTAVNVEIAILDGNGGTDTLTLRDPATTSDDKFFARPNSAVMFAADGSYQSNAFGFITTGIFGDGNDLLRFSDSPDNDTLTASPGLATFTGPTFSHSAQNFDVLVAVSLNGVDTANLTGTAGVDALLARAGVAVMSGTGFNFQLDSFETVNSNGLGSSDLVRFLGSAGDDLLNANPTSASFVTGGFTINTVSIERLIATAGSGANDVAILTDSAGNDTFSGTVSVGTLQGAGFFEQTTNFDVIRIRGVNGGVNTRTLNNIAFTLIEQGTWT